MKIFFASLGKKLWIWKIFKGLGLSSLGFLRKLFPPKLFWRALTPCVRAKICHQGSVYEQEAVLKATAVRSPLLRQCCQFFLVLLVFHGGSRDRRVSEQGVQGRGVGEGVGGLGGGGRGHFIHLAMYCTTTWCFALDFAQSDHHVLSEPRILRSRASRSLHSSATDLRPSLGMSSGRSDSTSARVLKPLSRRQLTVASERLWSVHHLDT